MKRKTTLKLNKGYVLEIKTESEIVLANVIKMQGGHCSGIDCDECPFRLEGAIFSRCSSYNAGVIPAKYGNSSYDTTFLNMLKAMGY